MTTIYAFGDSITYGASDSECGGWAARLRKDLDTRLEYDLIYNLGIPGETTAGLKKRFSSEVVSRKNKEGENAIFLFAFGANDSGYLTEEGKFAVDVKTFGENLSWAFRAAAKFSPHLFALNVTPVDEAVTGVPSPSEKVRLVEYIERYNAELMRASKANSVKIIDVYSAINRAGIKKCFNEDGLHPNAYGHEVISKEVKKAVWGVL